MSDAEKIQVLQQFQRPAVRMAFLRKVYGIVTAQLVLTALVVYALRTVPGLLPSIVRRLGVSIGLLPILPLALLSFGQSAGGVLAYALLVLFTATEALAVGAFTWAIPTAVLMRAAGATAVATGGLSLYALNTRRDFTMMGGMLFSCLLGLLSLGVLQLIFGGSYLLAMRSSLGLVVFCAYLVVNTQMMMGGNKKRQVRTRHQLSRPLKASHTLTLALTGPPNRAHHGGDHALHRHHQHLHAPRRRHGEGQPRLSGGPSDSKGYSE